MSESNEQGPSQEPPVTVPPGGNRRLDKVLAEDFLDGIDECSEEELGARRDLAEQEEVDLSYLRRLLQGRIDVVRAEQANRTDGGGGSVVDRLTEILADSPAPEGHEARYVTREPSSSAAHRRAVERLVDDVDMDDVQARTDEEIARALSVYAEAEASVSADRHAVQQVVARCDEEFARRAARSGVHGGDPH